MIERLEIVGIGHRGDGVAQGPEGAIYVPGTLPGETVEVEEVPGHPDRRRLLNVENESSARIAPICPHFGVCGGCAVQHWDEAHYRAWKRGLVVEALRQAGLDAPVGELVDAHGEGRRRAVFHARSGSKDVLEVGFAAARSHRIVAIDRCPVLAPGLRGAVKVAWALAETLGPAKKPLDIAVTATDAGLDVDVRGSGPLKPALMTALAGVAASTISPASPGMANWSRFRGRRPCASARRSCLCRRPPSFRRLPQAKRRWRGSTLAACEGATKIADLFAGIGPFALRLAERARVLAVDDDEAALAALKRAAATPGLKPVETERRDLFRRPLLADELKSFDAVVFDPPRQGAEAQARALAASRVPLIVAVSCNPATFARDAATLTSAGYRLAEVTPVDQFRYAAHVEIVARLER